MSWTLRRALLTVVAAAALSTAALVQPSRAQKGKEPPPPLPAAPAGPASDVKPASAKDADEFSQAISLPRDNRLDIGKKLGADHVINIRKENAVEGVKKILGGKTYVFAAYEGFRFPQVATFERAYPTDAFKKGVIQVPDAAGVWQPYNLNPFPVTVTVGNPPYPGASTQAR